MFRVLLLIEDDMRLIVKPLPCKPESLVTNMGGSARNVIRQLLVALTAVVKDDKANEDVPPSVPSGSGGPKKQTPSVQDELVSFFYHFCDPLVV
jgi:hypothetical protein